MANMEQSAVLPPGSLVHVEKPFAFVLFSRLRNQLCDFCFKMLANSKACAKCMYVQYCDKKCQKAAWFEHKRECKSLKNIPNEERDFIRLLGKVVIKLKLDDSKASEFNNLKCSPEKISNIRDELFVRSLGKGVFPYLKGSRSLPAEEEMFGIALRVYSNFFWIYNRVRSEGFAIYLRASAIQHACIPNAVCAFKECNIEVRTIENISDGDKLENVTVAYFPILDGYHDAECGHDFEAAGYEMFLMTCKCKECSGPAEESKLRKVLNKNQAGTTIELSQAYLLRFAESKFSKAVQNVNALDVIMKMQKDVLADTHLLRLKMFALEIFFNFKRYSIVLRKGPKLVKLMKEVFGKNSPELVWLYDVLYFVAKVTENDSALKWGKKMRTLCKMHGYGDHKSILEYVPFDVPNRDEISAFLANHHKTI